MKKTLITLMALSGLAVADTVVTGSDLTWDISSPYKDCTTVSNGNLTYSGGGWWVSGPTGTLSNAITLEKEQVLKFSCSFDFSSTNSILTLALVGDNGAVVMGKSYDNDVKLATTNETGDSVSRGYAFAGTNNNGQVANITQGYITMDKEFLVNAGDTVNTNVISFTVAYDTTKAQFVGTLAYNGSTADITLGETFDVKAITATFDGDGSYVAHLNDIKLEVIPEPTTATLSLLALAGLAARRRRK